MVNNNDLKFMQRAFDLSTKGSGHVHPNPMVGAVLVRDGKIIGEGYHEFFGGPHAEVNAITSARDRLDGTTLYVTLEPCNHQGKTPPCTQRIINEKISRVVIGMRDPNPAVKGQGAEALRQAGIEVTTGILGPEAERLNEAFIKHSQHGEPFVTLKTAMTLDGKIATSTGESRWITGEKARARVHELRHGCMGIMVGVDTVLKDDPELTDRSPNIKKSHPLRIVVDSAARTPFTANILDTAAAPTMLAVTGKAPAAKIDDLHNKGVRTILCPEKNGRVDLSFLMKELGRQGIDSILLEGGGNLNFSALREGVVDKVIAFVAPRILGGDKAITPVEGDGFEKIGEAVDLRFHRTEQIGDDLLIEAYVIKK